MDSFTTSTKFFSDNVKTRFSRKSSSLQLKHSKTISKNVLAGILHHFNEKIVRKFQNLFQPKFLIASTKTLSDKFKTCLSRISSSLQRKYSYKISILVSPESPHRFNEKHCKAISKHVLAGFLHHFNENNFRQNQNSFQPKILIASTK